MPILKTADIARNDISRLRQFDDILTVTHEQRHLPTIAVAVAWNRPKVVEYLIQERGVDPNASFEYRGAKHTPLSLAIDHAHIWMIDALIELGADVNTCPKPCSLLMMAIHKKLPLSTVWLLMEKGARFSQTHDKAPLRRTLALTTEAWRYIRLFGIYHRREQITAKDVQGSHDGSNALEFYAKLVPEHDGFENEVHIMIIDMGIIPTQAAIDNALETARRCEAVKMSSARSRRLAEMLKGLMQ